MRQLISCLVLPATSPARVPVTLLTTLCGMVPLPNTILPTINIHISSLLLYVLSKYPAPGPPAPFYLILPPNQIYYIPTNILLHSTIIIFTIPNTFYHTFLCITTNKYYHHIYFFAAYKYHAKTISRGMFFNIYQLFYVKYTQIPT